MFIGNRHLIIIVAILSFSNCSDTSKKHSKNAVAKLFHKVSSAHSGVHFTNTITERFEYFENFSYAYNGGGVALGDINNDGLLDIFFTGNEVRDKLYLNKGELKFEDITEKANIKTHDGWSNGVSMVDINLDGLLDIYACRGGYHDQDWNRTNLLYINQGSGTFIEASKMYGIDDPGYSTQAVFFDFDLDNDLDLYVVNRPNEFMLPIVEIISNKQNPNDYNRDKFYRNDNGKFVEIGKQIGLSKNFGYGLGVVASDLNGDGFTDIYVANDFDEVDYLYINQDGKFFENQIRESTKHISLYSMGVDIMDINNDGLEDIFVTEMLPSDHKRIKQSMPSMDIEGFNQLVDLGFHYQYMHNMLHLNQGNGKFSEIGKMSGVDKTDWSWSGLASDFDNDGRKDLLVTNGYKRDIFDKDVEDRIIEFFMANKAKYKSAQELIKNKSAEIINLYKPIKETNYLFKNTGDLSFKDVSQEWGFEDKSFSNGAAIGDLDNDGDLDIVINNLDDEAFIYENTSDSSNENNHLKIALSGSPDNPLGLGAKVKIFTGENIQYQEFKMVRGYLSSHEPIMHFGLGESQKIDSLVIIWPQGRQQLLTEVEVNQTLELNYSNASASLERKIERSEQQRLFSNSKTDFGLNFKHVENEYDDFRKEILLPHKYSRLGPGLSVEDINNDGKDDIYICGASGQQGMLYIQRDNGHFKPIDGPWKSNYLSEEISSTFFDANGDGLPDLYVVNGGNESLNGAPLLKDKIYFNKGNGNFSDASGILPNNAFSGSVAKSFDFDSDGDLDLFIGGRLAPQKYPMPASSYLYENRKGKFIDITKEAAPELLNLGLVTDVVWLDYDGNGLHDLVIAGEWMPITVFKNVNGKFRKISSEEVGFENTEGWWYSLEAGDFNSDGRADIIAGNLGLNYKYRASDLSPFVVYGSDFDNNGKSDIILGFEDDNKIYPVRGKECSTQQMPYLKNKYKSYQDFSSATITEMVGEDKLNNSLALKARTFKTTYFENNGDGSFSSQALPKLTQLSSVNDILIEDFDEDGHMDIVLAGNLYTSEIETPRNDASFGVFLKGDGKGNFVEKYPYESGLYIEGDTKGISSLVINGTKMIVVANNNDSLQLIETKNQ